MRYAEKVMLHNLVQQTMADKKAYDELSDIDINIHIAQY